LLVFLIVLLLIMSRCGRDSCASVRRAYPLTAAQAAAGLRESPEYSQCRSRAAGGAAWGGATGGAWGGFSSGGGGHK
jgi:hypothetical protein